MVQVDCDGHGCGLGQHADYLPKGYDIRMELIGKIQDKGRPHFYCSLDTDPGGILIYHIGGRHAVLPVPGLHQYFLH